MDRREWARALWLASGVAVLVAAPLVFANALHAQTRGQNEEIGLGLLFLATALAAAGAFARGTAAPSARIALSVAASVPVLFVAWFIFVIATVPDHDAVRTLQWEHEPDASIRAHPIEPEELPPAFVDDLRRAGPGGLGHTNLPREEYEALWDLLASKGIEEVAPVRGVVIEVEGVAWRVQHGPVIG